ncbi:MAG: hypothetical protein JO307_23540 [Bryobacterales bacterium]|nr:hypothetical protein [Bryobacterales bacterium]MBV9398635.1 hypothetical protein [Bryobacterales bacterium]
MQCTESGVASPSRSGVCEEYCRLLDEFGNAAKEVLHLHAEQLNAILQDDTEYGRFDLPIQMANERKHEAKYNFIRHVQEHGCSEINALDFT